MKKRIFSRINQTFPVELMIELNKITYYSGSNNEKGVLIQDTLKKWFKDKVKFLPLGSGTNRLTIQIGEYAFKIALDKFGMMDNKREFKYTDRFQPYVIKVYECLPDGLIICCETFILISEAEFVNRKNEILKILSIITENFLIGDIGFDNKNYANWGLRKSDKQLGILDFAYIYSTTYQTFACDCKDHPFLRYDERYVNMVCPLCNKKWSFEDLRERISRKSEQDEVGDIRDISYCVHGDMEYIEENPSYTLSSENKRGEKVESKKLKKIEIERNRKIIEKLDHVSNFNEFESYEATSFAELMKKMNSEIPDEKK